MLLTVEHGVLDLLTHGPHLAEIGIGH
jgi:hypothetical protein